MTTDGDSRCGSLWKSAQNRWKAYTLLERSLLFITCGLVVLVALSLPILLSAYFELKSKPDIRPFLISHRSSNYSQGYISLPVVIAFFFYTVQAFLCNKSRFPPDGFVQITVPSNYWRCMQFHLDALELIFWKTYVFIRRYASDSDSRERFFISSNWCGLFPHVSNLKLCVDLSVLILTVHFTEWLGTIYYSYLMKDLRVE